MVLRRGAPLGVSSPSVGLGAALVVREPIFVPIVVRTGHAVAFRCPGTKIRQLAAVRAERSKC